MCCMYVFAIFHHFVCAKTTAISIIRDHLSAVTVLEARGVGKTLCLGRMTYYPSNFTAEEDKWLTLEVWFRTFDGEILAPGFHACGIHSWYELYIVASLTSMWEYAIILCQAIGLKYPSTHWNCLEQQLHNIMVLQWTGEHIRLVVGLF